MEIQNDNWISYNKKKKKYYIYQKYDVVAIQRTQIANGMKLRPNIFEHYKVLLHQGERPIQCQKINDHEYPNSTSNSADYTNV